jgi:CDP-paratose 2-epimerase
VSFLAYLVRCAVTDSLMSCLGVPARRCIHSFDIVNGFWHFCEAPRSSEVYNIGGGRYCNRSFPKAFAAVNYRTPLSGAA